MRKLFFLTGAALCLLSRLGYACDEKPTLVIFGNSLSDTGNTLAISESLGLPPIPPPAYYFEGRYSNGPNWVDYIKNDFHFPVQNFALGGATTGTTNVISGYPFGGFIQEIGAFELANGGKFSDDMVSIIELGSNDFLSLLEDPDFLNPLFTQSVAEAEILRAISEMQTGLVDLEQLGSLKNIVWNLPDLAEIPLLLPPSPAAPFAPVYEAIVENYNAGLLELVQGLNENSYNHTQFFYFDVFTVLNEVRAELAAQGVDITDHTLTTIFENPPMVFVTGPPPGNLAFYDQEHPTTLAWSAFATKFAGYLDNLLFGPCFFAVEQDLVFESGRSHRDLLYNHYRMLNMQRIVCPPDYDCCEQPDRFLVYVDAEGKWGSLNKRGGTNAYKYNSQTVGVGADYWVNEAVTVGASFTYENSNANVKRDRGTMRLKDYIPTVYMAVTTCDGYFADIDFSYHSYHFRDIKRHIRFVNEETKGHTTGWGWEANTQFGALWRLCDCFTTGPVLGLGWQTATIRSYKERGAGYLDFKLRPIRQDSLVGRVGWQVFWNDCENIFVPWAYLWYEREFTRDKKTLRPTMYHTNDLAVDYHKIGRPNFNVLTLDIGTDIGLMDNLTGSVAFQGETTFHRFSYGVLGELDFSF